MHYIGYDIGSSSVKAALVNSENNKVVQTAQFPKKELLIDARHPGWAEQDPETWWDAVVQVTIELLSNEPAHVAESVVGLGISYQMHGLVLVDDQMEVLRPAIIWCDGRAVEIGEAAFQKLGPQRCLQNALNSPGNFTASKLAWVKNNEPEVYNKIHKIMLPGDYIAMRLTNEIVTTPGGLSEGVMWNFVENQPADFIMDELGVDPDFIPSIMEIFSHQGSVKKEAAGLLGIPEGIPVCYRAGDQPNNAMTLGVLEPGQIAATGGTSGVVYGVVDQVVYDEASRVNNFVHVNHQKEDPRIGVLLCINGTGILYRWIKDQMGDGNDYPEMEKIATNIPIGSEALRVLPFGNGAERILENRDIGARFCNVQLNTHTQAHFYRAALEGIAYSFNYGIEILEEMGLNVQSMRVGNDNLFQSSIFSITLSSLTQSQIEVIETTGAIGAARAVGFTLGHRDLKEAMSGQTVVGHFEPEEKEKYIAGYEAWRKDLNEALITK